MPTTSLQNTKQFGTLPVFLTSICTILGAILFLRFGWAVGQVGLLGTLAIILVGHLVTIPTALAIAEIATNQRVEGGGAYYIISRSFGLNIGGAIGIALYLSQAISVAFYVIAFAQSTGPLFEWIEGQFGWEINHLGFRLVSLPTMALLALLVIFRGANSGMNLLYAVAVILVLSLILFFMGSTSYELAPISSRMTETFDPGAYSAQQKKELGLEGVTAEPFFYVFTIIFPAFTGIIAGLGLSGDLKDPGKSIPLGTLAATIVGMLIYVAIAFKLTAELPLHRLANKDNLVMGEVAIWAPIIPIGLAAATISSALGSLLVAPRTLQALGGDHVFPSEVGNTWLARMREKDNEPVNGAILTVIIAFVFVFLGDVDAVAEIISMFFMVTYGAICLISFLEHFSSNPAYRPSFTSRWYFSLPGALLCIWLMFKMNLGYAISSILLMVLIYIWVSRDKKKSGMARIFQGVIFQISRSLRITLQKTASEEEVDDYWVPSIICISKDSFERLAAFDIVRFVSHKYGFGTYIHLMVDYYSRATVNQSRDILRRLLERTKVSRSKVFIDTIISPSYTTALAQVLQLPGISGRDNNMILFEYSRYHPEKIQDIMDNFGLIKAAGFDVCILSSSEKGFGYKHEIHVWITSDDYENGNLMILLAYIILGHPEWKKGMIKIFAIYPEKEMSQQKEKLLSLIADGRLAISPNNVQVIARKQESSIKSIIRKNSVDADLTLIGFRNEAVKHKHEEVFHGYDDLGNLLFVNTDRDKPIV